MARPVALKAVFTASLAICLAACAKTPPSASSVLADGTNKAGKDVTMLQAWISSDNATIENSGVSTGGSATYVLKRADCHVTNTATYPNSQGGTYDDVTTDCTDALVQAAKLPNFDQVSPILDQAIFEYQVSNGNYYTRTGTCELVEMRTLMANDILSQPTFDGIGFFVAGGETYVPKAQMHKVGDVTLADGRAGSVHRFFLRGMCMGLGGNGDSIYHRSYKFRPYARYVADGQSFNVWDDVSSDYLLGRTANYDWVQSFDRQSELLQR